MKLVLIRGIPGSGKSTMAETLCYNPDWKHLEADMYFMRDGVYQFDAAKLGAAHAWCQSETRAALQLYSGVVVTNTFTTVKELRPYFELAWESGIVPTVLVAQNTFDNVHNVPAEKLAQMQARFQYNISELFNGPVST